MEEMAVEPKWYILHTYTGYEALVVASLEKLIENNNLQDHIFDVKVLTEKTIEEKNGKKKVVERKLFPCYVFIKMIYSNQIWYLVTNTRGVTGFTGPQGRPIPLRDAEIRKLGLEEVVTSIDFGIGDEIIIDAGPLEGTQGIVKELNEVAQKAKITATLFGRETDVEVDFNQVRKLREEDQDN